MEEAKKSEEQVWREKIEEDIKQTRMELEDASAHEKVFVERRIQGLEQKLKKGYRSSAKAEKKRDGINRTFLVVVAVLVIGVLSGIGIGVGRYSLGKMTEDRQQKAQATGSIAELKEATKEQERAKEETKAKFEAEARVKAKAEETKEKEKIAKAEAMAEKMKRATIGEKEGIENSLIRQLIDDPTFFDGTKLEKFAFTGDVNDKAAVKKGAKRAADMIARGGGYIDKKSRAEIRVKSPNKLACLLMKDKDGNVSLGENIKDASGNFKLARTIQISPDMQNVQFQGSSGDVPLYQYVYNP